MTKAKKSETAQKRSSEKDSKVNEVIQDMGENKIGRPKKYSTVEEMEQIIEDYFNLCNKKHLPYTVSGLAIALDMTRETLLRYEEQNEFSDTIKRAKQRVEGYAEMCLFKGGGIATGVIFNLKNNFGWKDKTEIDNNIGNKDDKPFKNIDLSHLTTEQIKELLKNED